MSSETSIVAKDFRLQEWAAQIRECQSRPAGMSVIDWCACHGITKANYYYRLRRVRGACLETIQGELPAQQIVPDQISFMEVDGKIVFFNESEAVAAEKSGEYPETVSRRKPKKKQGKREEDPEGLPVVVAEHSMTQDELTALFGEEGFKRLPDGVYRRYSFTPAKVEVEEHHVKVYAGKKTGGIVRAPHPESLLRGSLVSPSLEAAVTNAKYVSAAPLYRQGQEFARYDLHISRQNMANRTIQCADRCLAVPYDYLHGKMYSCHVQQADETPVLVNKDGRPAGSKSYMWVYRTGRMYTDRQIVLYEYQRQTAASHGTSIRQSSGLLFRFQLCGRPGSHP